ALVGERVVAGHAAIVVEAQDLAHVRFHVLGRVELLPVAGADPEHAVVEGDAVRVVTLAADLGHLLPDDLQVLQRAAAAAVQHQPRAGHGRTGGVAFAGLGVADVDEVVVGEVRVQDHVTQAALAAVDHRRHAADPAGDVA